MLRPFMPERGRLADSLFTPCYVRDTEGRQFLEDLYRLASAKSSEPFYRPGEEPVDGKCPFNNCQQMIDSIHKSRRANHIHQCHKKELARQNIFLKDFRGVKYSNYPRFCYHCSRWFTNPEEWSEDCERHLKDPPVYCNVLYWQNLIVRSGLCPFCLGEENKAATVRFNKFREKTLLQEHLNDHFRLLKEDRKLFCPHPKCRHNVNDEALMDHFESMHSITPAATNQMLAKKSCKRKGDVDPEETKSPKKKRTSRKTNNSSKSQNKHSNTLSLDNQLENLKHSNVPSPDIIFENFGQENLFVDGWEEDWEDWEGKKCSLANPHDKHSDTTSFDDQFEDFNQEPLIIDGWEKGWEGFLDRDQWAMPHCDTDIFDIGANFHLTY